MPIKTDDGKIHQSQVIVGQNGFPIDGIATISGTYVFVEGTAVLTYDSGTGLVTTPVGTDLTAISTAKPRYTGKYILLTNDGTLYYINRNSINVGARTFTISLSDKSQVNPPVIDLTAGWKLAEADIVNRLATTSAAKIDSVEFRDMNFQMELDGDPVSVIDPDNPDNVLRPNPDGSINVVGKGNAGSPIILNPALAIAGDEYSVSFPSSIVRFSVKARGNAILKFSYIPADSVYRTIKPGSLYREEGLNTEAGALTLWVTSNKANTILEVTYWT